jgi:beta-lactam-binding protein with PASTA domain
MVADFNGDGRPDLATSNYDGDSVSVILNSTGRCGVPNLADQKLAAAKRAIVVAGCHLGRVARAYSRTVRAGRVVSQAPKPGALRPPGARIDLVVSRGRR